MRERDIVARLASLALHPAARGLTDDAAVLLPPLGRGLVLTHDILAEGVHYLPSDPPSDVAWKLLAVNLSDLAAMGAKPLGVLMGLGCGPTQDAPWLDAFMTGLARGLDHWDVALLGGDTVAGLAQAVLGLTAIGTIEPGMALSRSGAHPGDELWVSGSIGDAGLGLAIARGEAAADKYLLNRFRRPEPRIALGQALVGVATAAMDVSDGVLIDASRLAAASHLAVTVDLAALPLSVAAAARTPVTDAARLERATAGDDYELLFALPPGAQGPQSKVPLTRIGQFAAGSGLTVIGGAGTAIDVDRLGWEHASAGR
jgi:thiamine-monophosphate kinase